MEYISETMAECLLSDVVFIVLLCLELVMIDGLWGEVLICKLKKVPYY